MKFLNKNVKNILKKYIFCFYTNYLGRNRIVTVLANLYEQHIRFSLQLRSTYRRFFYKNNSSFDEYISAKNRKFRDTFALFYTKIL